MKKTPDIELLNKFGKTFFLTNRCYPTRIDSGVLKVCTHEPYDELLREALQFRAKMQVRFEEVDALHVEDVLQGLTSAGGKSGVVNELLQSDLDITDDSSLDEVRKKSQSEPVVKLVHNLINQAIAEMATDIHVEPTEGLVKVRYRKDGMLNDSLELPKWVQASLTSCLKIMSELDIAEKRLPQDGRIKWAYEKEVVDLRVSTLPTRLGEKIVMRILKHVEYVASLDSIGMSAQVLKSIRHIIQRPQGMLFVTGPTGSGKSSTLYAALREILHKDINISTIEDPIEYRLEGANQVQVNEKAGLNFASALRSLLRQDPDAILVGEIRDEETAGIAVQAAQTGHLVFSTLHTNDSTSAITRLLDLKVKPFLVSSAVLGVLAQRLVRRLCDSCYKMANETIVTMKAVLVTFEEEPLFFAGLSLLYFSTDVFTTLELPFSLCRSIPGIAWMSS